MRLLGNEPSKGCVGEVWVPLKKSRIFVANPVRGAKITKDRIERKKYIFYNSKIPWFRLIRY